MRLRSEIEHPLAGVLHLVVTFANSTERHFQTSIHAGIHSHTGSELGNGGAATKTGTLKQQRGSAAAFAEKGNSIYKYGQRFYNQHQ